ncbi:HD-GYP domain-containing protein [Methylomonas sp. SURF-1]|uniref:HD-GYP domain-containing protein n=1 Tax=Methylomonas aurea TaxID=2952224 RepID=A0ABT1UH32_9GAMM|nr:HD-GYP domain-containing protein [Methylomonas sp. SURF-1]MCQ8181538.1 HD-GYP domain-containing protein [Methylomonas sp. SURF-1]
MKSRIGSLRKILIVRLIALSTVVSILVGGSVFWLERGRFEAVIAERTHLSIELLKLRIQDIEALSHRPWESQVQQAVDDLRKVSMNSAFGHFVWLSIHNAKGLEIGRMEDLDYPQLQTLIQNHDRQAAASGNKLALTPLIGPDGNPVYAIGLNIMDADGQIVATLRGLYSVAPLAIAELWRDIIHSVAVSVLLVLLVTALHYPVVRRLFDHLGRLSIHLLDANLETLQAFGSAIAKRDSETDAHNFRVTIYAVRLAEAAGLKAGGIRTLIKGAFLHDIGKIAIRDHILLKPGKLDAGEFEVMKTHVLHGLDIINHCQWLRDAGDIVGNHHERFDGSGYYSGLKTQEIPLTARIFAIVDVFDALTSARPYKMALSYEDSIDHLRREAGKHFDPELLDVFVGIVEPLYHRFARHEEDARNELADIIQRYFKCDISDLFDENL